MKRLLFSLLCSITLTAHSQYVKIDDVGDGWKAQVDSALRIVETYDFQKYNRIIDYCDHIGYWLGKFSTTEGGTILISTVEMKANNYNNLAAILVHESLHLFFIQNNIKLDPMDEERMCYEYELNFLYSLPNAEQWLIDHAQKQIKIHTRQ